MKIVVPITALIGLVLLAVLGISAGMEYVFGVIIPYAAFVIFVGGFVLRVTGWMKSAVPFNITTTAGQQKSLPWIKHNELEAPTSTLGVIGRMALEVFAFRSLFRNTKSEMHEGRIITDSNKWLWTFGILFHYSFLIVFVRHLRFFVQPGLPFWLQGIENMDSMLQVGVPALYLTDLTFIGAVTFLFLRRLMAPKIRYLSFAADYFPLLLILGIITTGMAMRYLVRVDIMSVKMLTIGLVTFHPVIPGEPIAPIFYVHLFLVSTLFAYFPFSKLMHMGGVWLSPTRNMTANSRAVRHVNPWNYPVKFHTYEAYEDDFRDAMKDAGLPVEKE